MFRIRNQSGRRSRGGGSKPQRSSSSVPVERLGMDGGPGEGLKSCGNLWERPCCRCCRAPLRTPREIARAMDDLLLSPMLPRGTLWYRMAGFVGELEERFCADDDACMSRVALRRA